MSPKDGLPAVVCRKCRAQLDTCHRFREEAQKTQRKLQNFLQFANKLTGSSKVHLHIFLEKFKTQFTYFILGFQSILESD